MPVNHEKLRVRFYHQIFSRYESHYLTATNRDVFLATMQRKLFNFSRTLDDAYKAGLIEIYMVGRQLHESYDELLKQAEKCREKWAAQDFMGTEYNQPYIPVHKDVHKKHPRYITKFIVGCEIADYFLGLIRRLETARKRGGLHEREELKILAEAKMYGTLPPVITSTEIGFKWVGLCPKLRMETLYQRMRKEGYIERQTSSEQFHKIFCGDPVVHPLIWLKTNKLLMYFTDKLLMKGFVKMPPDVERYWRYKEQKNFEKADPLKPAASSWQYARIAACFISPTKPYTPDGLKHQRNDIDNKRDAPPAGGTAIDQLMDDIALLRE